jgi:hypothetical protein
MRRDGFQMRVFEACLITDILTLINYYRLCTPGVNVCTRPPVLLDGRIVYPHVAAQRNSGSRKQCSVTDEGVFDGAPNLVASVYARGSTDTLDAEIKS